MVRAALDKVPALDPHDIDDLMMGCGQPGGESGFNIGRAVAVQLGYDFMPGTTVNRYCSSSLQTSRMAFHAIKAGEGDVFISAGVETVSRFAKGSADGWPDTHNPAYADAEQRTAKAAESGASRVARPARGRPGARRLHRDGPDRREPGAAQGRQPRGHGPLRRALAEPGRAALANGFWERDITPVTLPDGTVVSTDDGPRAGVTYEAVAALKPVFRPDGRVTAGNCCPLNDGAAAVVIMSDTRAAELGLTPLARIVATGVSGAVAGDHGPRAGRGDRAGRWPMPG